MLLNLQLVVKSGCRLAEIKFKMIFLVKLLAGIYTSVNCVKKFGALLKTPCRESVNMMIFKRCKVIVGGSEWQERAKPSPIFACH